MPDDEPATPPAHAVFWDGGSWSCNCGYVYLRTDGEARHHYDAHFPANSTEEPCSTMFP